MPLPLILGIAAGLAAAGGLGTGIHGAVKMKEANDTMKSAAEQHEKNMRKFEVRNKLTTECMDRLGKKEIGILSTFERFANLFEQIQNRPEFEDVELNGNVLPKYNGEELKKVSIGACALMGGLGGAALGTAGGFAAAGATTAAVMALGTASTGTAIASLSGAAATNAALAALGGGATAIGGGGIALGTTMLGVTTAGIGLLVGGIVFSITGSAISNKADKAYEQMKQAQKQINIICKYLDDLQTTAARYMSTLTKVEYVYNEHMQRLADLIEVQKKINWIYYNDEEKLLVQNTVLLVGLLYKMCQVKLVIVSKSENTPNTVNHPDINAAEQTANQVLGRFATKDISNNECDKVIDIKECLQDEQYCVAMIALIVCFAKCDGNISQEEQDYIHATVNYLCENVNLSESALQEIESITISERFPFSKLKRYLDKVKVEKLMTFDVLIEEVIFASEGITISELDTKEKFDIYIKDRKLFSGSGLVKGMGLGTKHR